MTDNKNTNLQRIHRNFWVTPVLVGAGLGLALMILFLSGVNDPNPDWGRYWMVRPLVVIALAGAAGGLFYSLMMMWARQGKLNKILALVLSLLVYLVGLWMGSVAGLDGTLWN